MSTAIIICMHGKLGLELLNSSELIIGKQKNILSIDFLEKENVDNLYYKYKKSIKLLNTKKGLIFFVDIFGGSPFNAANKILNKKKIKCDIICGTNIPMILETLIIRKDNITFEEIINNALNKGKEGITNVIKKKNLNNLKKKKINKKKGNKNNMELKLVRIDDRLIHGQVSTG